MSFYPFQQEDAAFYAGLKAGLCLDDPRTGKTVKMLLAARQAGAQRVTVVTRAITREQWRREARKWLPTAKVEVWGYEELAVTRWKLTDARRFRPDVLLLDEAQQIRNPEAKRTQAIYGPNITGVGGLAEGTTTWILSGTLTPNHLGEAWTHLHALGQTDRGYLDFASRYCHTYLGEYGLKVGAVRPERMQEFRDLLRPIARRRRYRDVFPDAHKPRWSTVALSLSSRDAGRILELEREAHADVLRQKLVRATTLAEREQILQSARPNTSALRNDLVAIKGPLVADECDALLESGVHKLVVMAWHHAMLDLLQERLAKYSLLRVDGTTPAKEKDQRVQRFQTDPTVRVFLGQIRAAGEGIPLHAARTLVLAELPWSAGDVVQASQRIVSGERPDAPEILACTLPGTIDDAVAETVKMKAQHLGMFNQLDDEEMV